MLQVSDMIDVARCGGTESSGAGLPPARFAPGARRAPVVVWNVLRHCNMSCPHCYAAASVKPAPTDLTTADGLLLLDSLADQGVRVIIFSGGEPLLRPDLLLLIDKARRLGMRPHLSTNGALIDAETAARLAEAGTVYVGISIDGPRSFNDAYRGLQGGYDAAVRGLCFAKEEGMRTGLRLTLLKRNQEHLESTYRLAREVAADRFYVSHLLYSGRGLAMAREDLSREESRRALVRLFELAEGGLEEGCATRVVTGSNDSDGPFLLRWIRERYGDAGADPVEELLARRGGNSAGEGLLNIDARGRVHPDQFWTSETLGDVREQPLAEIFAHPLREALRQRAERLTGRCGTCAYKALCRGSHRERALAAHGDMWASDPACVLEDEETTALLSAAHSGEESKR